MNLVKVIGLCVGVAAAGSLGCSVESGASAEVTRTSQAVLGEDSFLYLRCNATGWGVDDATRMVNFVAPDVFSLVYDVTEEWMVTGADTCIVTETNELNGWGTSQVFSGPETMSPFVVPGTDALIPQAPGGNAHFQVDYAATGTYRALVANASTDPTLTIQSMADVCAGVCPGGLTCSLLPNGVPTCAP